VILLVMSLFTMVKHRRDISRRRRKLAGKPEKVNDAFIGSWF
jgi:multidrug efflux pump